MQGGASRYDPDLGELGVHLDDDLRQRLGRLRVRVAWRGGRPSTGRACLWWCSCRYSWDGTTSHSGEQNDGASRDRPASFSRTQSHTRLTATPWLLPAPGRSESGRAAAAAACIAPVPAAHRLPAGRQGSPPLAPGLSRVGGPSAAMVLVDVCIHGTRSMLRHRSDRVHRALELRAQRKGLRLPKEETTRTLADLERRMKKNGM